MDRDATDWTMDATVAVKTVKVTEAFLRSCEREQAICPGCHPKALGFGSGVLGPRKSGPGSPGYAVTHGNYRHLNVRFATSTGA